MWGGPVPVDGRSEMSPQAGMGRYVSTRALAVSVNVSKKAQKNLGESTHPISRTRSIQMIISLLSGTDGMTCVKAPTWDG